MIKGKALVQFGTGDILITPLRNNVDGISTGAVCLNQDTPGEINRRTPVTDQEFSKEASVILTFSKVESIDVLINSLIWLKKCMSNDLIEGEAIGWDEPFDLNIISSQEEL